MQKSFLVIFEVFLRLNSDLLDMISCFVTAVISVHFLKVQQNCIFPSIFMSVDQCGDEI